MKGFVLTALLRNFISFEFLIRTARWRSLVAGAIMGPSLLLTGHKVRHTSMAIYILLRAAVLAARCGLKSESAGWLFKPLSWKHGDAFLMCLSSCQILYVLIIPLLTDSFHANSLLQYLVSVDLYYS